MKGAKIRLIFGAPVSLLRQYRKETSGESGGESDSPPTASVWLIKNHAHLASK